MRLDLGEKKEKKKKQKSLFCYITKKFMVVGARKWNVKAWAYDRGEPAVSYKWTGWG